MDPTLKSLLDTLVDQQSRQLSALDRIARSTREIVPVLADILREIRDLKSRLPVEERESWQTDEEE